MATTNNGSLKRKCKNKYCFWFNNFLQARYYYYYKEKNTHNYVSFRDVNTSVYNPKQ